MGKPFYEQWKANKRNNILIRELLEKFDISPITAQLLLNRGIDTVEAVGDFLYSKKSDLEDINISGMGRVLTILEEAAANQEKILVYGDYDADGVTSTAIMTDVLKHTGADVDYYIPDRQGEGYDLNEDFVREISKQGFRLIITVDCGIRAVGSVEAAHEEGLKIIITDHHEPGKVIPPADAILNPKLNEGEDHLYYLAGVGVAYTAAVQIAKHFNFSGEKIKCLENYLSLAALGTVADAVPLTEVNRILVKIGLENFSSFHNLGLKALIETEGLKDKENFTETDIAYRLAPCINAAGRVDDAGDAVKMLLTDSAQEAWELAQKLSKSNSKRQLLEAQVVRDVLQRIALEVDVEKEKVIVMASEKWHPGVIGIAASRIVQAFNRPTLLISIEGEMGKGSGRSTGYIDLNEAFEYCSECFEKYGGHKEAGGFLIRSGRIEELREKINGYVGEKTGQLEAVNVLDVDCEVFLGEIDRNLVQQIELLKPFGSGNEPPKLLYKRARITEARLVGKNQEHLKLSLDSEGMQFDSIGFKMAEFYKDAGVGSLVDVVFYPEINRFRNKEEIQFNLLDLSVHKDKQTYLPAVGRKEKLDAGWIEKIIYNNEKALFAGNTDRILENLLEIILNTENRLCFLFPLQSMALDFERKLRVCFNIKGIDSINASHFDEEINRICDKLKAGELKILISTYEAWKSLDCLKKAASEGCTLCLHLGVWKDYFPGFMDFVNETASFINDFERTVLFVGSGEALDSPEVREKLKVSKVHREKQLHADIVRTSSVNEKLDNLKEICCTDSERVVVFVNSAREAVNLSGKLNGLKFVKPHEVRSYHGGLTSSQKELVLDEFQAGLAKVLVTSRQFDISLDEVADTAVIYSFPLNIFDFGRFLVAPKVYLNYNFEDIKQSFDYMLQACPDRKFLNNIYKYAYKHSCRDEFLLIKNIRETFRDKKDSYKKRAVKTAAGIISELGLLDFENSVLGSKKDVFASWRFREVEKELQAHHELVSFLEDIDKKESAATHEKF